MHWPFYISQTASYSPCSITSHSFSHHISWFWPIKIPIPKSWAKTSRVLEYNSKFKIDSALAVFNIIVSII